MKLEISGVLSVILTILFVTGTATAFTASYAGKFIDREAEESIAGEGLFAQMPDTFCFLSGAGAWSTELYLADDGTFTGFFHDSDMGAADPQRYPNGTVYVCEFGGAFTRPQKVDDYTYSVHVQSLVYVAPEKESVEDGVRYITSTPYGLDHADEVLIYLPGYPVKNLSEEALGWLMSAGAFWDPDGRPETLPFYALNNVNEQQVFFSEAQ